MRRLAWALALGVLTLPSCGGGTPIPNPCDQFPDLPGCGPIPPGEAFDCDAALESEALALTSEAGAVPFEVSPTGRYVVTVRRGARGVRSLTDTYTMENIARFTTGFAADMTEAEARRLLESPDVLRVEPDGVKTIPSPVGNLDAGPPAPVVATRLWSLDRVDQRSLPLDGDYLPAGSDGAGVHAYIIDTGISPHADFGGRLGNGFTAVGGSPEDGHGHGTHVAGTVGGSQFGVAPGVTLHPVRVLDSQGRGSDSGVIQGIEWVENDCSAKKAAGAAGCVANLSLGGDTSDALDLALCRLIRSGVFVAVAAGNDGLDACKYSPARVKQALTAMASDDRDNDASFSNIGPCGQCWAPGVDVTSARRGGGETTFSGTSMASPHLAGAAARIIGAHPDAYAEILRRATPSVVEAPNTPGELLYVGPEV